MTKTKTTVAAVQMPPVFLDRDATTCKACDLIAEAASRGARLIVFPETFIPTYPIWVWSVPASDHGTLAELYAELLANSVAVPGEATGRLCAAARQAGAYVVVGINEPNDDASNASLYNSIVYIDPEGMIMGVHRKLVPTAPERLVWTPGDGAGLDAFRTPLGTIGGLICWENYMPLARFTMYAQGVNIYLAPTYDAGDVWLASLRHIAKEGGAWVIGCGCALRADDIPDTFEFKRRYFTDPGEWINEGDSVIVDPEGNIVAGPLRAEHGILYAEIETRPGQGAKWKLDTAGHYNRPDIFELVVNTEPRSQLWRAMPEPEPLEDDELDDDVPAGPGPLDA